MEDVLKGRKGVPGHLSNLGLVHESVVEDRGGVLFLALVLAVARILSLRRLLGRAGDIEAHLEQLISGGTGLLAGRAHVAGLSVGAGVLSVRRVGKLNGHFVLSRQVGVGDLRVRDLEGRAVLDVEGKFMLAEFTFAPVPTAKRVFFVLQSHAIPHL